MTRELLDYLNSIRSRLNYIDYLFMSTKFRPFSNKVELLFLVEYDSKQEVKKFVLDNREYEKIEEDIREFINELDYVFMQKAEEYLLDKINELNGATIIETRKIMNDNKFGIEIVFRYNKQTKKYRAYYKTIYEAATYDLFEIKSVYSVNVID